MKEQTGLSMAPEPKNWRRKWGFRVAALLAPLLLLVLLEVGLRLFGYGYPTGFFLKSHAQGRDVWVENQKVTWRYFSPALARSPQPTAIAAIKPPGACRIFVLGESAAMGDPEPAFGFGRILQVLLGARHPSKHFEVVNVAMTAINSHVIREIARDCGPRQGDLWILYLGNNEVVGPFGAGTVFGNQAPNLGFIRAGIALKALRVGQLVDVFWRGRSSRGPAEWAGMEMFLKQQIREDDPRLTKVYHHFEKNLEDILQMASASGSKVLLSTVVSNLKDCPPFGSLHGPEFREGQDHKWDELYQAGIMAEKAARYEDALAHYQKAAQLDNRFAELVFRQGRCQWAVGKYREARRSFEGARDLDTLRFRADTRINQLIRKVAESRSSSGLKLVDTAEIFAQNSPHGVVGEEFLFEHVHLNFSGNYLLARTLEEEIEAAWPVLLEASPTNTLPLLSMEECARRLAFTDWDRYQMLDEMFKRLGEPPFAQQLDHAVRDDRLNQARAALQPSLSSTGLLHSIEIYDQALALAPADWVLHENFAKLLQSSGDPPGAEKQWRKVIELMPGYEQAYYSLGNVLDGQGKSGEALQYFQQALRRRPESLEAHNGLGLALANQGRTGEAIREYEAALRRKPAFSEARINLGQTLAEQGRVDEALAQYEIALRFNSNDVAAHINLGKLLASQNQMAAATGHYQTALRLKPDNAVAHYNLGNALASQGQTEEAMSHFAEAVRYKTDFAEAHYNLGLELARLGRTAEALEQFTEAVRVKPGFAEARLNLGVALAKERRIDEAIQQFQEALRLEPANPAARKLLDQALAVQKKGANIP